MIFTMTHRGNYCACQAPLRSEQLIDLPAINTAEQQHACTRLMRTQGPWSPCAHKVSVPCHVISCPHRFRKNGGARYLNRGAAGNGQNRHRDGDGASARPRYSLHRYGGQRNILPRNEQNRGPDSGNIFCQYIQLVPAK